MGFLINTRIDPWIQIDAALSATQAQIRAAEHPCLDHDSFVDCHELFPFDDVELTAKRDGISSIAKQSIKEAVRSAKTLVKKQKRLILNG